MTLPSRLAVIAAVALLGLAACETNDEAEREEDRQTTQQRQPSDRSGHDQMGEHHNRQHQRGEACPMAVEGTQVDLEKRDDTVAVDFTTTGDVDQLREHVGQMAQMHSQQRGRHRGRMPHGQGRMPHGRGMMDAGDAGGPMQRRGMMDAGDAGRPMRPGMMMRDADIRTEEIEGGMRIIMTPRDPDQLDKLYQHMQQQMQRMEQMGDCPMRQMMGVPSDGNDAGDGEGSETE